MYYDSQSTNREGWKYTYQGGELLPYAKAKLKEVFKEEEQVRQEIVALTQNMNVGLNSPKMDETKRKAEALGRQREALEVYVHEFERTPGREFHLSLGDVVYFNLTHSLGEPSDGLAAFDD